MCCVRQRRQYPVHVYPDHVDVYANGALVWTRKLWKPVSNSTDKLCIGNLGYMHYYTGAIAEIALRNKAIDKNELDQTFNEINAVLIRK